MKKQSLEIKQLTDEELAGEAQAGSRRCFEELVRRYSRRLFYYFRPRMSTCQDTEDLIQETFLKTYRNIRRFHFECKFSTWIYTTASRLAISFYRKKKKDEPPYLSIGPAWAGQHRQDAQDPQEQALKEENYRNLWDTARGLGENQFQALWLRFMEDLTLKEIARVMKKNQVHVRVLLHRARLNLVKQLNPPALPVKIQTAVSAEKNLSFL